MAGLGIIQRSFAGGRVGPTLGPRRDTAKVDAGLRTCRNFVTMRSGGAQNRAGFEFVATCKDAHDNLRLVPWVFNDEQAYLLEFGEGYIRFFRAGAAVTVDPEFWDSGTAYEPGDVVRTPGVPNDNYYYCAAPNTNKDPDTAAFQQQFWYVLEQSPLDAVAILELPTPYAADEIPRLGRGQSADVATFAHPSHPPYELVRHGETDWTFLPVRLAPRMPGPTGIAQGTAGGDAGSHNVRYLITAVKKDTLEESLGGPHEDEIDSSAVTIEADIAVNTAAHGPHGLSTGDEIYIVDVVADSADEANYHAVLMLKDRIFPVTVTGLDDFTLDDTAGLLAKPPLAATMPAIQITFAKAYLELTNRKIPEGAGATAIDLEWLAADENVLENRIYRSDDKGPFGFVKATRELAWTDEGEFEPDLEFTPPHYRTPFRKGHWPAVTGYYQQRQLYAATESEPQRVWLTRVGDFRDLTTHSPLVPDDAVDFSIPEASEILNAVSLGQIVFFTGGTIWTALGDSDGVITATTVNLQVLSYEGASRLLPLLIGDSVLFLESRASLVRELRFDIAAGGYSGYAGRDLTVFAPDLFDGHTIRSWAFGAVPLPIAWAVRDDGVLLGLTYLHEQEVWAWHDHTTGAAEGDEFLCVAVIPEEGRDALYAICKRQVDGSTVYYIERQAARQAGYAGVDERLVNRFLDSSLTFDGTNTGAETMTLSGGTTWEEGEVGLLLDTSAAVYFTAGHVGNGVRLVGADGEEVEVLITAINTTQQVVVTLLGDAPASVRATALTTWVLMVDEVSGLDHLEGREIYLLADLNVLGPYTVTAGAIPTLDDPHGIIHAGLLVTADIELLDLDHSSAVDAILDRRKKVSSVTVVLDHSRGVQAGTDEDHLYAWKPDLVPDDPLALVSGKSRIALASRWDDDGRVLIRQNQPLPCTVTAVVRNVEIGGREP